MEKTMNTPVRRLTIVVLSSIVFSFGVLTLALSAEPVGPKLTPRLKELLSSEMKQVSKATADLAIAIAGGEHSTVTDLGTKVRDSFILKQSLTPKDKKDLMAAVPPEFVAIDRKFHGLAAKLSGAGKSRDSALQVFYFGKMLDSCVQCHSQYASDRFNGLAAKE
jgi:hypothetical protein